jgi:hypothetical protein
MKALALLLTLLVTAVSAQDARKLEDHALFKHFLGKWTAKGELTGDQGNKVLVEEAWEGRAGEPGSFIITGTRILNEKKQSFLWTIIHNPTTDGYEATMITDGDEAGKLRFEAQVSEIAGTMEMKSPLGANGSVTIHDTLKDDHKTIESVVTFIGDTGSTTLSGTILHQRVK